MPNVTIMQFSDLHKTLSASESSNTLVSSIVSDIGRYASENIPISKPDALVVCGDIIRGSTSSKKEVKEQYERALDLLNHLCTQTFDGNKERVILVPGNHDISWPHSRTSMTKLDKSDNNSTKLLKEPRSYVRWSWDDLSFYRISDANSYNQRFLPFARFYSAFYNGKRKYSLNPQEQFDVFEFPEKKLLIVGFNSCFCNDHLNYTGMINPECMAACHSRVNNEKHKGWIKVAVWHHGVHGVPSESDFMDERTIQFLIDKGFIIGLHGHQHKSDLFDATFSADRLQKMLVFGCGTLSAPNAELPPGETRQYNIIEILRDRSTIRLHIRKAVDLPPGLHVWMPGNVRQNYDRSYMDIKIDTTVFDTGKGRIKRGKGRRRRMSRKLVEAEQLVAVKEYASALDKLKALSQDDPFVRRLTVECLFQLEKIDDLVQYIKDPTTITEFTFLCEALWRRKKVNMLKELVEKYREIPEFAESEPFKRVDSRLKASEV